MGRYDQPNKFEGNTDSGTNKHEDVFSRAVRAGKRTYFFDVKSTRRGDYYISLTESIKRFGSDGRISFDKHKVFLYKEDFEKFVDGLTESIEYCKAHNVDFIDDVDELSEKTDKQSDEPKEI
ncbi:MAG: DUF3276 family protein [Bacteroidota bacterium]|nr:DUF3276 family protein [Bacteroidota bacterium]